MKIWSVFSLVIVFHVVVIGLLLIQPGCQSQPSGNPSISNSAPPPGATYTEPTQTSPLDSAFNSGVATSTTSRQGLSSPSRPQGSTRTSPDTSRLTPVLDPVQEDISVPTIQGEYTVKKGDNLTTIAKREGVSLSDLLKANSLSKSTTIFVGQKLVIPAGSSTVETTPLQPTVTSGKQVVVAAGDTLGKIANRAGTTVSTLKSLNGLSSDTIYIGQKLLLPDDANVSTRSTSSSLRPAAVTPAPTPTAGQSTYTVKAGDTPSGIARKFGVTTSQLMAANGITDARKMSIGKVLVVPQGGSVPVAQPVATTSQRLEQRSDSTTTPVEPVISEPSADDPMSILEALEDEDIPFAEVEVIEGGSQPGN